MAKNSSKAVNDTKEQRLPGDAHPESREAVERFAKVVADCINRLQWPEEQMSYFCGVCGWDDGVCDTTKEARRLLGEALASLVTWFDVLEKP